MTAARMLATFKLWSGNSSIRFTHNSGNHTITLSAATEDDPDVYAWAADDSTTGVLDFQKALQDAIDAVYTLVTVTVSINGIDITDATKALHRLKITVSSGTLHLRADDALTTIDPGILGLEDEDYTITTGSPKWTWVPRYCWCPQIEANEDLPERMRVLQTVGESSSGHISGFRVRTMRELSVSFWPVGAPFARQEAANDSNRSTNWKVDQGDLYCSLEQFLVDLTEDLDAVLYFYPDMSVVTAAKPSRYGPYRLPPGPLYEDPLALSQIVGDSNELWRITVNGRNAVGNVP